MKGILQNRIGEHNFGYILLITTNDNDESKMIVRNATKDKANKFIKTQNDNTITFIWPDLF